MTTTEETDVNYDEEGPKVFKLTTGEEIITTVTRTTEHYFVIEVTLEIRFNTMKGSLYLTKWKFGADYSKVMTLAGSSVVSVSVPEPVVVENYFEFRKGFIEHLSVQEEEEYEQIEVNLVEDDSPTLH